MDSLIILLGIFVVMPPLALVPALFFGWGFVRRRRPAALAAALAWLAYFGYELGMYLRILCSGECDIRVDLLLVYPFLALVSLVGAVSLLRARLRSRRRRSESG